MIIVIINKKYRQLIFNIKIDAEEYEYEDKIEKSKKSEKKVKNFENLYINDKNNLEKVTTKEISSFEELSKKEENPIIDHGKIFAEKYKKRSKLIWNKMKLMKIIKI